MTRVRICSVPGCETNCPSTLKSGKPLKITYQFPKDEKLRQQWLKTIGLKKDKKYAHICIDHFKPTDLIRFHTCDGRILLNKPLDRPKLKPGIIPNIFKRGQGKNYDSDNKTNNSSDNDSDGNIEFLDQNSDDRQSESENYNEPAKKKFRSSKSNVFKKKIATISKISTNSDDDEYEIRYEEDLQQNKLNYSSVKNQTVTRYSKDSGVQCNLYEELWMQRAEKELKLKKCRCIEDFFIYLNPKSSVEKIEVVDPILQENIRKQSIKLDKNIGKEEIGINDTDNLIEELKNENLWAIIENQDDFRDEENLTSISIEPISKFDETKDDLAIDDNFSVIIEDNEEEEDNEELQHEEIENEGIEHEEIDHEDIEHEIEHEENDSEEIDNEENKNEEIEHEEIEHEEIKLEDIEQYTNNIENNINSDESENYIEYEVVKNIATAVEDEKPQIEFNKLENGHFECKLCLKTCRTLAAFRAHARGHSEKSTLCMKCGRTFARSHAAALHANKCQGANPSSTPNEDEINYLNRSVFDIEYENLDLNYATRLKLDKTCKVCGKYFPTTRKYFDHINVHTNRKPYKCHSCRTQFSNYSNFLVHVKKFKCPFEGLVIPKYAPQSLATELGYKPQLKPTKRFECRICGYVGSKDIYINHFSTNPDHFAAEETWIKKFNLTEFSCKFCKVDPFSSLIDCISHSRTTHKKFPSNEFIEWYEENQWLITTSDGANTKPTDADFCLICKIGLSDEEIGDHLCTDDHLENEQKWLERSKIHELKCTFCPNLKPFPRLFEFMLHRIEDHITHPNQNLTIKEFIYSIKQPLLAVILPNENGDIITENGHAISTNDVGGLEYVKEGGGRFLCRICQATFAKRITYFDHQVAIHKKLKPYKCSCDFEGGYYDRFIQHTIKHRCSIVGRIMPAYAPKTFQYHGDNTNDLNNIVTIDESNKSNEIDDDNFLEEFNIKYCNICDSNWEDEHFIEHFNDQYHLDLENQWKKSKNINYYDCSICGIDSYNTQYSLIMHQKYDHNCEITEEYISTLKSNYE